MAKYRCTLCGEIYDEEKEGVKFDDLPDDWVCPACFAPKKFFEKVEEAPADVPVVTAPGVMGDIQTMAATGKGPGDAMETLLPVPDFSTILIMGNQLDPAPLDEDAEVSLRTVIGKKAAKPMVLETPVFVSHMSFGALSATAKTALSKGQAMARTAMCSGEGGVLLSEAEAAYRYIYEYPPNGYSLNDRTMELSSAIEIKIGQGTKPGMGGHLPGAKVTPEIAQLRGKPAGKDILSPSRFPGAETPEGLRAIVEMLRERGGGIPVGVKIAAGHIESDLEFISESGCDFITIDGRGGATGSSPKVLRDSSSVPTVYALARARRYMDAHGMDQDLIMTGGFRSSADVFKALAMGADAVAMASAPLMALGCEKYRICGSGQCPKGIATQNPELEKRLDLEQGAQRVGNYLNALSDELRMFCRVTGCSDLSKIGPGILAAADRETAEAVGLRGAWLSFDNRS